jgi:CRP/FNR family cyclic AMP-dependent transcriptional regulator
MKRIAVRQTYEDGQIIIKENGYSEGTYIILSGEVRITRTVMGGELEIALLKKGDYFGEMSFFDRQPRSASAKAMGKVQLGLLDKDFLDEEINKTSEDFRMLVYTLVERLRQTTSQLVNLMSENHELKKK